MKLRPGSILMKPWMKNGIKNIKEVFIGLFQVKNNFTCTLFYILLLYLAMMLIGSKGNNFIESWFTTITILLTVGVFAYTISEIANIINSINKDS